MNKNILASNIYYVSPNGSNGNVGTKEKPFATLEFAKKVVNTFKNEINDDMTIVLLGGNHFLNKPVKFTVADQLPNDHKWIIRGEEGEEAVINGGKLVTNWEETELNGVKMFRAHLPAAKYIRTFYVDGEGRNLASKWKVAKADRPKFGWIPFTDMNSFEVRFHELGEIHNPKQLEVIWNPEWKICMYRAESVSPGNIINMNRKYFKRLTTTIKAYMYKTQADINGYWWPNPGRHGLYIQNDINLITNSGDFCFDEEAKYLYYYPKDGENPAEHECIYSNIDYLIDISGVGHLDKTPEYFRNIQFRNLTFGYAAYSRFSKEGLQTNQSQSVFGGVCRVKNNYPAPTFSQLDAHINVNWTKNVSFRDCIFKNTVASAIYYHNGVQGGEIVGCVFKDIGDSAIMVSDGITSSFDDEHVTCDLLLENNLIRNVSLVNHGATGIQVHFARHITIRHNDIYNTGYSGMCVGWGWTACLESKYSRDNLIEYNKVGHFNSLVRDGGGIYTLGQQPNSVCRYNYVYEQMEAFGSLYHDEGTCGYTTYDNVVDTNTRLWDTEQRWLNLNGFPNGPGGIMSVYNLKVDHNFTNNRREGLNCDKDSVTVTNTVYVDGDNWPPEAVKIMNEAGLEEKYQHLYQLV